MKIRRTGALVLSATLLMGVFAGCSTNTSTTSTSSAASSTGSSVSSETSVPDYMNAIGEFPITKEKITIKAVAATNSQMAKDWNTLEAFQKLETLTNIHFDFTYVDTANQNFKNQFAIQMAGNDYPEVFISNSNTITSDDEETYGPTGKLMDLTPYLKYAPHFEELRDEIPAVKNANTASDGKIYGLPNYTISTANVPVLTFFDKTWLAKTNTGSEPATTDELYTFLKAVKASDSNAIPFCSQGVGQFRIIFQSAFQGYTGGSASDEWDVDSNGNVVYLPEEKGYKEYLTYCNKLYKEGLINQDYATITADQMKAKELDGEVAIYAGRSPTDFVGSSYENDDMICLPPLTSSTNSTKVSQSPSYLHTTTAVITTNCKHVEALMSWFDLLYRTPDEAVEGFSGLTSLLGYEGEQWQYTDSSKTTYEFISPTKSYVELNQNTMITFGIPAYINLTAFQTGSKTMEAKMEQYKEKCQPYNKDYYPLSYVRMTQDEKDQSSTMQTDLDNYLGTMEAKFINGDESLDNFDTFISNLKTYHCDDLKKIYQAAYDRYTKSK